MSKAVVLWKDARLHLHQDEFGREQNVGPEERRRRTNKSNYHESSGRSTTNGKGLNPTT